MKNTDLEITILKTNQKMLAGTITQLAAQNSELFNMMKAVIDFSPTILESVDEKIKFNTEMIGKIQEILKG